MNERGAYRELLFLANSHESSAVIDNDTWDDSADVMERIFLSCSNEVLILARGVKHQIFGKERVIRAAQQFLSKGNTKLKMILRAKDEEDCSRTLESKFLKEITGSSDYEPSGVELKFYEGADDWLTSIGSTTIGDDRMYRYRYEQDVAQYSVNGNAQVCFNDVNGCEKFKKKIFKALESEAENKMKLA